MSGWPAAVTPSGGSGGLVSSAAADPIAPNWIRSMVSAMTRMSPIPDRIRVDVRATRVGRPRRISPSTRMTTAPITSTNAIRSSVAMAMRMRTEASIAPRSRSLSNAAKRSVSPRPVATATASGRISMLVARPA